MQLNEVISSNIKKVGYDNNNLIVEYLSGVQYEYTGVPKNIYEDLLKADSKGSYMNSNIKGKYEFKRLS